MNGTILLLAFFLLLSTVVGNGNDTFGIEEKIVGTYYFYWYDYDTSFHITVGDEDSLTHHPSQIESFSYLNEEWHRRELMDMIEGGIDFLLPVYWGDRVNRNWAIPGLESGFRARSHSGWPQSTQNRNVLRHDRTDA